jgi:thiol-disulfide isomerase/thioredoxin
MRVSSLIAVGAVTALSLAACAPGQDAGAVDPDTPSMEAATEWANPDAPDTFKFMATDLVSGEPVDGTTLIGQDAILWFWASWCPICAAESGVWVKAQPDIPEGTVFLGIAGLSDAAAAKGFIDEHGMEVFPHIYDEDGTIWRGFGVTAQPTMILINQDGRAKTYTGGYGYHDVVEKMAWLAES